MRRLSTTGPPIDHTYDAMTDDGCPLTPDLPRPSDDDWRDSLGAYDTFDEEAAESSGAACVPAGLGGA